MSISDNVSEFAGLPVLDFDPQAGILFPHTIVYRLRLDYSNYDESKTNIEVIKGFLADPSVEQVQAFIIGLWGYDYDKDSSRIVQMIAESSDRLPNLKALFLGDITFEECEISWIQQSDVSPLLSAFPQLEYFRVRGGNGLSLGELNHTNLKSLIVESGGLSAAVVRQIASANLPALEHLEVWLGAENYGAEATIDDVKPILYGNRFPKLRYLGLRDSEIQDDIAGAVAEAPILNQIETLDLSLGILTDKGAEALLQSAQIKNLKKLDIHHHYVSEALVEKLQGLGVEVDASDKQTNDEDDDKIYRYVSVGE